MRNGQRTTRRNEVIVTIARKVAGWLRRPALLAVALLGAAAGPAAYLSPSVATAVSHLFAPGDTVAVYGPHQFNGSGGNGTTYVERFTVALVPGRQYLLRLDNGAVGGGNRATSAVTTLNGAQVVGAADLTTGIASAVKALRPGVRVVLGCQGGAGRREVPPSLPRRWPGWR